MNVKSLIILILEVTVTKIVYLIYHHDKKVAIEITEEKLTDYMKNHRDLLFPATKICIKH
jgi:hypothetical protein